MAGIEELLRKRAEMLESIDREILAGYTRPVTLLFTDIVGSTRYYERMGDIAGRQMVQTHNDLLFPLIEAAGGRVIKTIGDSIMASFEDPVRAVGCAVDMQKALERHNSSPTAAHRFHVRMGLHHGRAVVDERDLFGDMVNTAARVEAQAEGDEILVSGQLAEKLEGSGLPLVLLGEESVKGREEKVRFLLVNWQGKDVKDLCSQWEKRRRLQPSAAALAEAASPAAGQAAAPGGIRVLRRPDPQAELAGQKPPAARGNPYLNRVMLPHPSLFFGRRTAVKRVMERIGGTRPQSVSIVAERRMGKSSLLNYLRSPQTRIGTLGEPDSCIFLLIDFQQVRSLDQGQFFAAVFAEARRQLKGILEVAAPPDDEGMRVLCEAVSDAGLRLVFLFDEFECVTRNEKLRPEFYSFLRSLANTSAVGYVTASGRDLKQMCASKEISDSPFFNIFTVQGLGLFTPGEARALVAEPSAARGIPLAPLAERIVEQAGCHPFFLQIACSAWYEYLDTEGVQAEAAAGRPIPRDVAEALREEMRPHFEFLLETTGSDEKAALCACVKDGSVADGEPGAASLEKRGWLERRGDRLVPFGSELALFLSKNLSC